MQLVITIKDGANSREIAEHLRKQADLIDQPDVKTSAVVTKKKPKPEPVKEEAFDAGEGFIAFAVEESEAFDFDDDIIEEPSPKKAKKKKLTIDDVSDVCKAHAAKFDREATLEILKKKFNTGSIQKLKPEQYQDCVDAMQI